MVESHHPLDAEFQRIRDELGLPRTFPDEALAEADSVASRDPLAPESASRYASLLEVPFVTIDPPASRDLDQAFYAERRGEGYFVRYAIDDLSFFVARGGAVEGAAWRRGETLYSPDVQTPLYPPAISEGCASLLPDVPRPAIVFTFELDEQARPKSTVIARAVIRSRAKLAYQEVSEHLARERERSGSGALAGQEWSPSLTLLEEIGRQRQALEIARNGVSLRIPSQHVERWSAALTGYRLTFEQESDVEGWNAQISLMTGMAAAEIMISRGVGLLRALDPPRPNRLRALRLTALALQVAWPPEMDYDDFVRSLDPANPVHVAIMQQAAKIMGGARYVAFEGAKPAQTDHAAIAAPYAHVTAPLRRLADRYVLDLLVELAAGRAPSPDLIRPLPQLPQVMQSAAYREHMLESMIVDFAEALLLRDRVGQPFEAVVIDLRRDGVEVQITDPPVRTVIRAPLFTYGVPGDSPVRPVLSADGAKLKVGATQLVLGQRVALRLDAADPVTRSIRFTPLPP